MKKRFYGIICITITILTVFNLVGAVSKIDEHTIKIQSKGTIVIDAGHGGEDGGAVGVDGISEKDINLAISLALKEEFENGGYQIIMTREVDTALGDTSLGSVSARKKSDMYEREELFDNSEADLVISIHQNHFTEERYSGSQVFYKNENSKDIAEAVQYSIINDLQPNNNRVIKSIDSNYLLNNTETPMIIIECGFISNYEECKTLQDENYQKELSNVIFKAVDSYLN